MSTSAERPTFEDIKREPESAQKYREQVIVNGIEISVGWDKVYDNYTIFFPQIKLDENAKAKGVVDQVIIIASQPEVAKKVFDYASQLAETEKDVYAVYGKVDDFIRNLQKTE